MKLGIISDTHGFLDPRVETMFAGVDHILHAGDIGSPLIELELKFIAPVTVVLGNCDADMPFKDTEVITLADKKFLVHHIVNPWSLSDMMKAQMKRHRPDAVIFGHTHKRCAEWMDGTLFFNPGYSGRPKSSSERSVALLHLEGSTIRHEFVPL